ncbi:ABC-type glycerol-3-phosphate transport system permease component [Paenibacillus sp. PastF-3]|nr:ABC-type glycerol-3-phosphate transport system permease component [Paenibacillus sp. PastF-3]
MMIPFQAYMIPLFKELRMLGLYGSLAGPILIYVAGAVGFGCLLYTSFVKGIPREIEEEALPSGQAKTLGVEIYRYIGQFSSRWDMIFAGTAMSVVPVLIVFIALQKYFVKGIASGATKG